jgi:hypothetical protein
MTKTIAAATGIAHQTVEVYFRKLREAELLTTGARGVNAAQMKPLDAARILISVLISDRPVDAPDAVRDFGQLVREGEPIGPWPNLDLAVSSVARFENTLANLIQALANSAAPPVIIRVFAHIDEYLRCVIGIDETAISFHPHDYYELDRKFASSSKEEFATDYKQVREQVAARGAKYRVSKVSVRREITGKILLPIAAEFREASP